MAGDITFTATSSPLKGKRAAVVARMIEKIVEADANDDVVTWDELIQGVEHPHQYTPALHALEMVGAVRRWEYREYGTKGVKTAYSLTSSVNVVHSEVAA